MSEYAPIRFGLGGHWIPKELTPAPNIVQARLIFTHDTILCFLKEPHSCPTYLFHRWGKVSNILWKWYFSFFLSFIPCLLIFVSLLFLRTSVNIHKRWTNSTCISGSISCTLCEGSSVKNVLFMLFLYIFAMQICRKSEWKEVFKCLP
jgi:hypothetical protein